MITRFTNTILLAFAAILLASCGFGAAMPDRTPRQRFLPGECLAGTSLELIDGSQEMQHHHEDGYEIDPTVYFLVGARSTETADGLNFGFSMDFTNHTEGNLNWEQDVPSAELFQRFGKNKNAIEDEYWKSFQTVKDFTRTKSGADVFNLATILYSGGISLTANKEFAGYAAGDNLAPIITGHSKFANPGATDSVISSWINTSEIIGPVLGIPIDYTSMTFGQYIIFTIPKGEYKIVQETVQFELEIPVKVVMYLTWLNNRLTDIDTPVPYRDEVLHASFSYPYRLK